jgi:hypothetical protein
VEFVEFEVGKRGLLLFGEFLGMTLTFALAKFRAPEPIGASEWGYVLASLQTFEATRERLS